MENHIENTRLQDLLEEFVAENPYGDTFDLARWFFNRGYDVGFEKGKTNWDSLGCY